MIRIERIVNGIFASNTYAILDDGSLDVWLIDAGDIERILNFLPSKSRIRGVFLTHTHFDHIYGINKLYQVFPDCIIYTSEYGKESLYSAKKNFSYYHEDPFVYQGNNITILREADEVTLYTNVKIQVFETPGHCPSCLTYLLGDNLFTGDSYIPGLKVVSKLPNGDKRQAELSQSKILLLAEGKRVYPGHGK